MLRIAMALALAFTLWGCPSNTSTHLVGASAPPAWRIELRHGSIRGEPTTFIQAMYRVRSGTDIVWEITRTPQCDAADAAFAPTAAPTSPAQLHYGVTPDCYRQTVAPQPIVDGRAYLLESDDARYNHSLHKVHFPFVVERGLVRAISDGRYRRMSNTGS